MSSPQDMHDDAELERQTFERLAASLTPTPLSPDRHLAVRARLLAQIAPPPDGTTTFRKDGDGWTPTAPNVEMKMLRIDAEAGTSEMLIRLGAGVRIPEHSHRKEEQMIILEGELLLGDHLLQAGDSHVAPPGSWHPAITVARSVLMLLRSEYPLPAE